MKTRRRIETLMPALRATIAIPYLAVLLAGPFADAVIDAAGLDQHAHIEAESTVRCGVGHDEYMCQLCRLVELPACRSNRHDLALTSGTCHRGRVIVADLPESKLGRLAHHPRAPPLSPPSQLG